MFRKILPLLLKNIKLGISYTILIKPFFFHLITLLLLLHYRWSDRQPIAYQDWKNINYGKKRTETHRIGLLRGLCSKQWFFVNHCFVEQIGTMVKEVQQESLKELYPQKSKAGRCTVLLIPNLAYPQWVSVICDIFLIPHVVCFKYNNTQYMLNPQSSQLLCYGQTILKDNYCYKFIWFHGRDMSLSQVREQCKQIAKDIQVITNIKQFHFIFDAVNNPQFIILSQHTVYLDLLISISFHKTWFTSKYLTQIINSTDASGHFVSKSDTKALVVDHSNVFLNENKEFMSSKYICDQTLRRPDLCLPFGRKCKQHAKELNYSFLYYESKDGKCLMFNLQTLERKRLTLSFCKIHPAERTSHANDFNMDKAFVDDLIPDCNLVPDYKHTIRREIAYLDPINHTLCSEKTSDEPQLKVLLTNNTQLGCNRKSEISCRRGHPKCYNITALCLYTLDRFENLSPCRTGSHLESCEKFEYNKNYKCFHYYCIPWRYVCDGKWDCPHGFDELKLNCGLTRQCKSMLKCKNSQICVHMLDMCNEFRDCPLGDDEDLCELQYTLCPRMCICLNFAISCQNIMKTFGLKSLPYVSYHLAYIEIDSLLFLKNSKSLLLLHASGNYITDICSLVKHLPHLTVLDVSFNHISKIITHCFMNLNNLQEVKISRNNIFSLDPKAFYNLQRIILVDLIDNLLLKISASAFFNITPFTTLKLKGNPLKHIAMIHILPVQNVFVDNFKFCCITPDRINCRAPTFWYSTCFNVFPNNMMKYCCLLISLIIVIINLTFFVINITFVYKNGKYNLFTIISCSINVDDSFCGIYLLLLWIQDRYYKNLFYVYNSTWNNNIVCQIAFISILNFSLLEPYHLSLLSLARLMVCLNPFNSYFMLTSFILKCILGGSLPVVFIVLVIFIIFQTKQFMVTSMCSPYVDPSDSVFEVKLITWFVGCIQLTVLIFICSTHIFLIMYLNSQQKDKTIKITKAVNWSKSIIHQLLVTIGSNLISWITPTVVFVSALHLPKYSQDLLLWIIVLAAPFNCILNPTFYHFF